MKRIISICLVVVFVLGFVACGGEKEGSLLSDDPSSLMFQLDGAIYTLPLSLLELETNDWEVYDPDSYFADEVLEPGEIDVWELRNGDQNIAITFANLSEEILLMSESHITGFAVLAEWHSAEVVLPGNITIGSTYEDMMEVYGDMLRHIWEFENSTRFSFHTDTHFFVIIVDIETNLVVYLGMDYHRSQSR